MLLVSPSTTEHGKKARTVRYRTHTLSSGSRYALPTSLIDKAVCVQDALEEADNYAATLSRSLALVLEEFYQTLQHVAVSSITGEGMQELMQVPP